MKRFETYIDEWEANAKKDAYWSVLTTSENEETSWNKEKFFQTGVNEIRILMEYIEKKLIPIGIRGCALDFGCGVGRLTQALGKYFHEVHGTDISKNMLCKAKDHLCNSSSVVQFHHNPSPDLKIFDSEKFDFIYSNIVLQHIAKDNQLQYLTEFARVIKPGGWIIVQIPSRKNQHSFLGKLKWSIFRLLPYKFKKNAQIYIMKNKSRAVKDFDFEVNVCSENRINQLALENKLEIKHLAYTNSCEPDFGGNLTFYSFDEAIRRSGFLSPMYFMRKRV